MVRPGHRVPPRADLLAALALVQVAWRPWPRASRRVALVDPLAVDPEPLAKVLDGPGVMVAHAASQNLEVLGGPVPPVARQPVRHPDRGRFPRLRFSVPGVVCRPFPRPPPRQRRPPHRLEPSAAHCLPGRCTPPRTWPTCSSLPTSSLSSSRARPPGLGPTRERDPPCPPPEPHRAPGGMVEAARQPPISGRVEGDSAGASCLA